MEENLKNEVADQIVNLNKQKQVFWWQKSEISLNCSSFLHYYITKMHCIYHTVVITAALLKNEIYIYIYVVSYLIYYWTISKRRRSSVRGKPLGLVCSLSEQLTGCDSPWFRWCLLPAAVWWCWWISSLVLMCRAEVLVVRLSAVQSRRWNRHRAAAKSC